MSALRELLTSSEDHRIKYQKIRKFGSGLVPSGYEISGKCNLYCEGCHFFEGEHRSDRNTATKFERGDGFKDLLHWENFLREEKARGVTYPHFGGAEPALEPERLQIAAKVWRQGVVYTNGTIKISESIPFMLHIGVWSFDESQDAMLRGEPAFKKMLVNYKNDDRVVVIFTITPDTISEIEHAAQVCSDHGLKVLYNHFSATNKYLDDIASEAEKERLTTHRFSNQANNLLLDAGMLSEVSERCLSASQQYPDTVIVSAGYNDWINQPGSRVDIDPVSGRAINCATRNNKQHREYRTDLSYDSEECCTPNVDCSSCRLYAPQFTQYLVNTMSQMRSVADARDWIEGSDMWCRAHIPGWDAKRA